MANRTVKDASSIHGTNPQYLIEKIIRTRIYDSKYWKEECFALTAELLVDKAMALRYIGGVYGGNIKPSPFLCLTLKMLQIQPEKDIVIEFIKQDEFKYVRALGCFYMRLVHSSLDCYKYLGPLLNDYRKLRIMDRNGVFLLSHMDEYIDNLLREERYSDVILPRIQKRWVHEANNELEPRVSLLEDDLDDLESESEDEEDMAQPSYTPPPLSPHHRSERRAHAASPGREKRRRDEPISPDGHKRRRTKGDRGERERGDRRHRDSGRGERDRGDGDHYNNGYSNENYHDYHHTNAEYLQPQSTTDYHHRRPHHGGNSHHHAPAPLMAGGNDYHHHSSSGGGGRDHHHGSNHHRGVVGGAYNDSRSGGDYYKGRGEDVRGEDHHSRRHSRREEGGSSRRKEGREGKEGKRKEGRSSRRDGGNVQAQIEEANSLRAQLGLPPLK